MVLSSETWCDMLVLICQKNQNKDIKDNKQKLNEKWKILMSIKVE